SGQNRFNGSLFEFHRNSAFDAKNFFDPADKEIPAFKRNQFGGAVGGPIRKDRTFFFAAYESLIERLGVTGVSAVPDADARQGRLPGRPPITLHPAIPAYLQTFFPLPNGRNLGGGVAEYLFTESQPTNEYFVQGALTISFRLVTTCGDVTRSTTATSIARLSTSRRSLSPKNVRAINT